MARLVIIANRVPSARDRVVPQAGGLTVALRDALGSRPVLWFGWTGAVTEEGIGTPSIGSFGSARTATVDLTRADLEGYYNGYANATLWPLLHYRLGLVDFQRAQFRTYCRVNADLAAALHPLLAADDEIWVNDYQLIPFGAALRALGVRAPIGFFLHVPFPPPAVLEALPDHETLGRGLAAYDLVGVQTRQDLRHLRAYLTEALGGRAIGEEMILVDGRLVRIGAFGVGIDADAFARTAAEAAGAIETARLAGSIHGRRLVIGVDRLDYSKGLPQRFAAFDALLDAYPEHRGRVTFLQIAPTSRGEVQQYRALRRELEQAAGRINSRYAEYDWQPLRYLNRPLSRRVLAGFYRLSRVGLVTPLRDGMNLVAKEFVAAQRPDDPGALVLSRFAGAAERMDAALLVNPLDTDGVAAAIHAGLTMPLAERVDRWSRLMAGLREHDARAWVDSFLGALAEPALA